MITIPRYGYKCQCGKEFLADNTISGRKTAECECGKIADRDFEIECKLGTSFKLITDNPRWSISMGVPPSQVEEFRKRYPNSEYDNRGRLLVKNRKDKLRQAKERGFEELDIRR